MNIFRKAVYKEIENKLCTSETETEQDIMYVQRKIEGRSCNYFCLGKASVTYFDCVSVALVNQHAKRMCRGLLYCHL